MNSFVPKTTAELENADLFGWRLMQGLHSGADGSSPTCAQECKLR